MFFLAVESLALYYHSVSEEILLGFVLVLILFIFVFSLY